MSIYIPSYRIKDNRLDATQDEINEALINLLIQKGIIEDYNEIQAMIDAMRTIKKLSK